MMQNTPVLVMNPNQQREAGSRAQLSNIVAARAVSDIVKSTLGPKSMLKMLLDPMGGIVLTNDGNCILRELDVSHPTARSMIELARTQDENVGDGTTTVVILTGELLKVVEPFLTHRSSFRRSAGGSSGSGNIHPVVLVQSFYKALTKCLQISEQIAIPIEEGDGGTEGERDLSLRKVVESCIGTKYTSRYGDLLVDLAIKAVDKITVQPSSTSGTDASKALKKLIDIKRHVRIEKIPGGELSDIKLIDGIMLNKDVTHSQMRRKIENPKILLLDCSLEYKKTESQAHIELSKEEDFDLLLKQEEEYIMKICANIISYKPDLVFTEKGVSDLAQHFLMKAGITVFRRLRKTDNNRLSKALGIHIVNNTEDITEHNISKPSVCGLFEVRKIGDEYFSFIEQCVNPKACSIMLRGGSKDVLNEMERNLQDCLQVVKNVALENKVVIGGGCFEMCLSRKLQIEANSMGDESGSGVERVVFSALSAAFEVIPRTLLSNCGCDVVRQLTKLRALHAKYTKEHPNPTAGVAELCKWGVDGDTGEIVESRVLEPLTVKTQVIKTAFEAAAMILRIDDIISGVTKGKKK